MVNLAFGRICLVAMAISAFGGFRAAGASWFIETVDSNVANSTFVAVRLAVDSNNHPHIAYFENSDNNYYFSLKYARHDGIEWDDEEVEDETIYMEDAPKDYDLKLAFALDDNDCPCVCYSDEDGKLYCNHRPAAGWTGRIPVDTTGSSVPHDMCFEPNGVLNISYRHLRPGSDDSRAAIKHARGSSSGFAKSIVVSDGNYLSSAIALDSNNKPHISFYDDSNNLLKYAAPNGGNWTIETVENVGDVSSYIWGCVSLALDGNDRAHIGYYNFNSKALKYAYYNGSSWIIETVDDAGNVGRYASLALDSLGRVHIAYQDRTNGNNTHLKYALQRETFWQIEMVDSEGNAGKYASLALDSNDIAHICAYDSSLNHRVRYARLEGLCGDTDHRYPTGDMTKNCYVDMYDFASFASHWLEQDCADSNGCQGADLDKKGTVDINDVGLLGGNWLECTAPECD